ncbi:hypothetical protein D9M71_825580 [compost metagenome]
MIFGKTSIALACFPMVSAAGLVLYSVCSACLESVVRSSAVAAPAVFRKLAEANATTASKAVRNIRMD